MWLQVVPRCRIISVLARFRGGLRRGNDIFYPTLLSLGAHWNSHGHSPLLICSTDGMDLLSGSYFVDVGDLIVSRWIRGALFLCVFGEEVIKRSSGIVLFKVDELLVNNLST
ncbi:hypothetical protein WG66_000246 [Moniliophthora roreri]|nr:hypothetical protein WG66_000246 [Moniliophthora roreri]